MRILFVQAISTETTTSEMVYPIGIVTLATVISNLHTVEILDLNIEQDPFKALKNKIYQYNPEVVFMSLRNIDPLGNKMTSLIPQFITSVKMINILNPTTTIIAGGTGFSLFPRKIMELLPEITYGIIGEGESSILPLLNNLDKPNVKGLCYRKGEDIIVTSPSMEFDMEKSYIVPDRSLLDVTAYQDNSYVQSVGVETKRGCPFNCSYCVYPKLQGKKLRCREPNDVVNEIEFLRKEYGIERIHFTDPVVNIPNGHMESVCESLIRRNIDIKWSGFFREDQIDGKNIDIFAKSGCECFSFSPDGLTQEAMDVLGKNMNIEDVKNAARLAAQTDIVSVYHFMINVPGETEETVKKGINLIDWIYDVHSKNKNLGTIVFNNIRIYPDTPIYDIALEKGVIRSTTNLLYPVYYNPDPYENLRYELEGKHFCKNVFMWQEVNI
ncbi:B12 lower ligand biosynthesis radical SAM protein BzaD [Alkalibaculum sp. M08DMB]|uniref:B12 lower ligand biosynthesis radical SAM protein BzaD n=1 Tax=Alkalibaculum sporogenes TaxID=2655001 RepID=A0A6A7KCL9_9FIRM|nr:B12 lower ligand biosynthesis radical SAM protein BzaD [Alkalibaculum sporogenes]MPW27102.1 B12 lower ligand biosynthesis radical SAM protein BzaD [Alkalibaculum sporogenes]